MRKSCLSNKNKLVKIELLSSCELKNLFIIIWEVTDEVVSTVALSNDNSSCSCLIFFFSFFTWYNIRWHLLFLIISSLFFLAAVSHYLKLSLMRSLLKKLLDSHNLQCVLLTALIILSAALNRPGLTWEIWLSDIYLSLIIVSSNVWLAKTNSD